MRPSSLALAALIALIALCAPAPALAAESPRAAKAVGRPNVKLDQLVVPLDFPSALQRHLKFVLRRAARRADWGAGRGAHIEFRFVVKNFALVRDGDVLRVNFSAVGKLPGGMHAASRLSFGGDPREEATLTRRVLEAVARGVVQRLADLERQRRGSKPQ
jgi:hypothetical protein